MLYRIVKKIFGANESDVINEVEIPSNIHDFCFIPDLGYLFALKDNHCISLLDLEGNFTLSWLGMFNEKGCRDGTKHHARLSYPSSVCYLPQTKRAYVVEDGGANIRIIDVNTVYISKLLGKSIVDKMEKKFAKIKISEINTCCCVNKYAEVYWVVDKANYCYKYKQGNVKIILGNRRASYSVSSDISWSSLNGPSGLALANDAVYIADTGNHCIRELTKTSLSLFEGTPIETELVNSPSCLKHCKGMFYFLDGNQVKYYAPSGPSRGVLYENKNENENENLTAIDVIDRNLLILEGGHAKA